MAIDDRDLVGDVDAGLPRTRWNGEWPFSDGDVIQSKADLIAAGERWRNVRDDYLVGVIGRESAGAKPFVLAGAHAELQRRQLDATRELTQVQKALLATIELFNAQTADQTAQMLAMTRRMEWLTWAMAVVATLQLIGGVIQTWMTIR